jgi:hypothetical protein
MVDHRTRLVLRGSHSAHLFADGEPRWTEGKKQRPCISAERAIESRKRAIKLLKRHGANDPRATCVRKRLEACAPDQRCLSGACPECHRAYQRWFVAEVNGLLQSENRSFRVVSIVPQDSTPEGKLNDPV